MIRSGGAVAIEEWKSANHVKPWHRAQMGMHFLLAAERYGVRPTHGFIVCSDDSRRRIENTEEPRASVLDAVERIRAARRAVDRPIPVHQGPGQCRPCGMRGHCDQARL